MVNARGTTFYIREDLGLIEVDKGGSAVEASDFEQGRDFLRCLPLLGALASL